MIIRALTLFSALLLAATLSACGLTPVYGTHANSGANAQVASSLSSIYIDNIPDRSGQRLKNLLMDRMYSAGRPGASARYRLQVAPIGESIYGLGIAKDATATRSQIRLATTIWLIDAASGDRLMTRTVKSIASFNTLASQYTTLVTEEDARIQTIEGLAQQIVTQLELYFSNPGAYPAPDQLDAQDGVREPVIDRQAVDWADRDSRFNVE